VFYKLDKPLVEQNRHKHTLQVARHTLQVARHTLQDARHTLQVARQTHTMGLSESKPERLTTEKREQREQNKTIMVEQRKQEINYVQQEILGSNQSTALIKTKDLVAMIKVTETAKNQLDRGGGVLTKPDLIAIIVALQPEARNDIARLESVTVSDLNSMIRSMIYDPSRGAGNSQSVHLKEPGQKEPMKALTFF